MPHTALLPCCPPAMAVSGTPLGWAAATGDNDMLEVMIEQAGRGGLDTPDIHGFGIVARS